MALTPAERKAKLGLGGIKAIADELDLNPGSVSLCNNETPGRESPRIRAAITARIVERHPEIDPADIWPEAPAATSRATA